MSDYDLVKRYIALSLEERVENRPNSNNLEVILNKNLAQDNYVKNPDEIIQIKKELDELISMSIGAYKDLNELKNYENKKQIIDQIYLEFGEQKIKKLIVYLESPKEEFQRESQKELNVEFDANLILSEIFMPEKKDKVIFDKESVIQEKEEQISLDLSQIKEDLKKFDYEKLDSTKILSFFEMIKNYNFKMQFQKDKRNEFQVKLLIIIYCNDKYLDQFIFQDYFVNFLKNFTDFFFFDFQARIVAFDVLQNLEFIFICSYNNKLCETLIQNNFLEKLIFNFNIIDVNLYHLIIKILINLVQNYPSSLDKIFILNYLNRIIEQIQDHLTNNNFALLLVLINKIKKAEIKNTRIISKSNKKLIIKRIMKIYDDYPAIKLLGLKFSKKQSNFNPQNVNNELIIQKLFKEHYKEVIEQSTTYEDFDTIYFITKFILEFFSLNTNYVKNQINTQIVEQMFNYVNITVYQISYLNQGLITLRNFLDKTVTKIYYEQFFYSNLFMNILNTIKRSRLNEKSIEVIQNLQSLIIRYLEIVSMKNGGITQYDMNLIFNILFEIRKLVQKFYDDLKKKYIEKSYVKFLMKIKYDYSQLIPLLEQVLSQNSLLLQILSKNFFYKEFMEMFTLKSNITKLLKENKLVQNHEIIEYFDTAIKRIYICINTDKKGEFLVQLLSFNMKMLINTKKFVKYIKDYKLELDFNVIKKIFEYLTLNLYFITSYDEEFKEKESIEMLHLIYEIKLSILKKVSRFIQLNSNYQIYCIIENFNLIWYMTFNYKFTFYDKITFVFLENIQLQAKNQKKQLIDFVTEEDQQIIYNFLNDLVDLKNKCNFLNFIIIKQLDILHNSLNNISDLNQKFIVNIFKKSMDQKYNRDLYNIDPQTFFNLSESFLNVEEIQPLFLNFIYRKNLFFNEFIKLLLQNVLTKNYWIKTDGQDQENLLFLMDCQIYNREIKDDSKLTKFLFQFAQQNISSKNLFKDVIYLIKKRFQKVSNEQNILVVQNLFNQSSLFDKLIKLYKKDKVNLNNVLKNLLKIAINFNLLDKINIPEYILNAFLTAENCHTFQQIYPYLMEYIFQNKLQKTHKNQIQGLFQKIKTYLDNILFFFNKKKLDEEIKSIYYGLKVIRKAKKLAPLMLNISSSDYIIKYVFELYDKFQYLQNTEINNLYIYFVNAQSISIDQNISYKKKLIILFLEILEKTKNEQIEENIQILNKLINYFYLIIEEIQIEKFEYVFSKYLLLGLKNSNMEHQTNFFNFYLILYYKYHFHSDEIKKLFEFNVFGEQGFKNLFDKQLHQLKFKNNDSANYNKIIESCILIYYILSEFSDNMINQNYHNLMLTLNSLFEQHYQEIKHLFNLEKILIAIYIKLQKNIQLLSLSTAKIFLDIFNKQCKFKLASKIDKYIYMGLFNNYFNMKERKQLIQLDRATILYIRDSESQNKIMENYKIFELDKQAINEIVTQLELEDISESHELIILQFLYTINYLDKDLVASLNINKKIFDLKYKQITQFLMDIKNQKNSDFILFIKRLYLVIYLINKICNNLDKEKEQPEEEDQQNEEYEIQLRIKQIIQNIPDLIKDKRVILKMDLPNKLKIEFYKVVFKLIKIAFLLAIKIQDSVYKSIIIDTISFLTIDNDITNDINMFILNSVCYILMKVCTNVYDEVRVCNKLSLIDIFLQINISKNEIQQKNEDNEQEKEIHLSDISGFDTALEFSQVFNSIERYIEQVLYLFVQFSKNPFLLNEKQKKIYFSKIYNVKQLVCITDTSTFLFNKLIEEYVEQGMIFEEDIEGKHLTSLQQKEQNLLYIQKVLLKLNENLQRNNTISEQEERFLIFSLNAMEKQIIENLDPEIFERLNLIEIFCKIFLHKKIKIDKKLQILQLIKNFFKCTKKDSNIKFNELKNYFSFKDQLLEEQYPEVIDLYFKTCYYLFSYIKIPQSFLNEYFDDITENLFKTRKSLIDKTFIGILSIYTLIMMKHKVNYNFDDISNIIYRFLKLNDKKMDLIERCYFALILILLKQKTTNIDNLKYQNMLMFIRLRYNKESKKTVIKVIKNLSIIPDMTDNFQDYLKKIGFELFFKKVVKKFGKNMKLAKMLNQIYLKYSFCFTNNNFDMLETLKNILDYIELYYILKQKQIVINFYKCLVNASLMKQNAKFLLANQIYKVILTNYYENDVQFYQTILSLLFNIIYILDEREIDLDQLFNPQVMDILDRIFEQSLAYHYQKILEDLIDILILLIQHNFFTFFTNRIIKKIKLALNFYYNDKETLKRLLTILKDLSISDHSESKSNIQSNFDFVYLYHIHFRNVNDQVINALVKHLIYNLILFKKDTLTEKDLVMFGIPENIIHTFSLEDQTNTIVVNLKIILYSLRFQQSNFFVKNHFLSIAHQIIFKKHKNINDTVLFLTLNILHSLIEYYGDPEVINAYFYFNKIEYLFEMIKFYENNEKFLLLTLKLIKNYLEHQKEFNNNDQKQSEYLSQIIQRKHQIQNPEIMCIIYEINKLLDLQKVVIQGKKEVFELNIETTQEEKQMLEQGSLVDLVYEKEIIQNAYLRYDIIFNNFILSDFPHKNRFSGFKVTDLKLSARNIIKVDSFNRQEVQQVEEMFSSFFKKKIQKSLYYNIKYWIYNEQNVYIETVYIVFQNEFKASLWKKLLKKIINAKKQIIVKEFNQLILPFHHLLGYSKPSFLLDYN